MLTKTFFVDNNIVSYLPPEESQFMVDIIYYMIDEMLSRELSIHLMRELDIKTFCREYDYIVNDICENTLSNYEQESEQLVFEDQNLFVELLWDNLVATYYQTVLPIVRRVYTEIGMQVEFEYTEVAIMENEICVTVTVSPF